MSLTAVNGKLKKIQRAVVVPGEELNGRYFDELTQTELNLYLRVSGAEYNAIIECEKFIQNTEKPNLHFKVKTRRTKADATQEEIIKAISDYIKGV
mgnify:CR=1 FL=1